jgi:eukaryotic-like serine/threonine-protein kinase
MPQSPLPSLNELGGKYRILADLGQGGTATVSLAVARGPSGFSKLVVLKVMKSTLTQEHEFSQMFMNEARLAARLNHPNIVQTNEVFEHHGLPVIVMEYLEGQALSGILSRARGTDRFPLAMHLRVISDVLGGLHYSHELKDFDGTSLNVVHRDMSPHNVFVTFDGQVKLLDFGIAKLSGSHVETATGVIKGKIRYMSPEQITGENVDRRADIFAVGVMLWEAATDGRMWAGMSEATIMNQLLNGELPRPRDLKQDVDPELERIIMKALASNADNRYGTAAELQADLDEYLGRMGTQARPRDIGKIVSDMFEDVRTQMKRIIESQLSKVASLTDAEYAQTAPLELTNLALTQSGSTQLESGSYPEQRSRAPLVAVVALLLLLVAGLGWAVVGRGNAEPGAAKPPNSVPVPEVPPTHVQLRITAFPAVAKIYLDNQLLPGNPHQQAVPREATKHALRFEAPDHRIEEREISFEQDSDLVVALTPLPKAVPSEVPTRRTPTISRLPPPRPVPPRPVSGKCDPPYTVDSRGVKKYKPECL